MAYRNENALSLAYHATAPYVVVEIFDVLGKRVFTTIIDNYGGRSEIYPKLNRGAYVVHISSGNLSDAKKVFW